MKKIVTTSNATPSVQKTSKTLALSIVKVHPSNSNILAEMASENGCRLLQTCDLDSLSKDQIEKLKEVLKAVGWLKLGDKPGLSSSNASELKEKMEKLIKAMQEGSIKERDYDREMKILEDRYKELTD